MSIKVCLFGDSIGKGVVFDSQRERYVPCHESFANLIEGKHDITINNRSSFGCTVVKGERLIEQRLETLGEYDIVAMQYGGNDSDFDWASVAQSPEDKHDCKTSISLFAKTYSHIIDLVRGTGAKPVMLNLTPVDSSKYYRWITRTNDPDAIARFLGTATRIEHWNEVYNNAVWSIASSKNVPVLDIRSPILYERNFSDYFCVDGIHPNADGHRVIAKHLLPQADALLAE